MGKRAHEHHFVIPLRPIYQMPLPARSEPRFNPNLQRLVDAAAVDRYLESLPEDYYDTAETAMDEIEWDRSVATWPALGISQADYNRTVNEARRNARRGAGGGGGGGSTGTRLVGTPSAKSPKSFHVEIEEIKP